MGVRETRHFEGEATVTAEDIRAGVPLRAGDIAKIQKSLRAQGVEL